MRPVAIVLSVFLSACLSITTVSHTDQDAVWHMDLGGPRELQ